jgi:hypothetical protein
MGQHGAALARGRGAGGGCKVFRAPPSLGRQLEGASEPDAEPRPRARWSTHYSPRAHVPLTRRLRRAVAVWPEEPGLTPAGPAPTPFYGDVTFIFYTVTAPHRPAPHRSAPRRAPPPCAAPSAQRRLRLACAAPPALRCLCRDACAATPAPCRRARRRLARLRPSHRAASPVRPCLLPAPPCADITKCSLYTLVCTESLPAAYC